MTATTPNPPVGAPAEGPRVAGSGADPRIAASADNWKRKLLDLTKRNRALNFRPAKVATVAIVDEQPAEIFRRLFLREDAMRFKAAPEPREAEERGGDGSSAVTVASSGADAHVPVADEDLHEDLGEYETPELDFAPYDPAALDGRHADEWLQTSATPEALDKSLRRLDEQARLAIEEQGVNTLHLALGMLHYRESADSSEPLRAPLVLLPVELTRTSARSGYVVRATDDDPVVNPALAEYLRRDFGITLPELPDSATMADDYDLQEFFTGVSGAVAQQGGWSVKTDAFLALFSFQKLVMYKDLEVNAGALVEHRLVRQLVTRSGEHVVGLPAEVREMDLDAAYPPESTYQVVDADSSQLRAIAAVAAGHDLVIEGPPGTGKSQTITNLIARALAEGRSVLFVAEKMAALQVVHGRLVAAGLGEFCLELHSTKANKRAVMRELAAALDASLQGVATPTVSTQRLPRVRSTLSDYVRAVHDPHGALGASPYQGYGEFGRVLEAPRVGYDGPVEVERERLDQTVRDLDDLAAAAVPVGAPARHPWRDTTRTFYAPGDLDAVRERAADLAARLDDVVAQARRIEEGLSLPPVRTFADVRTAAAVAEVMHRSPGAPLAVLASDAWNAPPADATGLVEQGRAVSSLAARVSSRFTDDVLEQDHAADADYVERKAQGVFGFLAFLDGRHRAIRKRWAGYRRPGFAGSLVEQANEMRYVDRLRASRAALSAAEPQGRALFCALWRGERSDWDVLESYIRWVVEFRGLCVRHNLSGHALELASRTAPDVSAVERLRASADEASARLDALRETVGWPADHLASAPLEEIAGRARELAEGAALGPRWAAFEAARQTVAGGLAGELLPAAMRGELPFGDLSRAFRRAFWLKWLTAVVRARPALERFHTLAHEERVAEFRQLDQRVLLENRAALVGQLRDRVQHALRAPEAAAALPALRAQMARQRGHAPLRVTMQRAAPAIRAIKPCFLMSPLTAAQYLEGARPSFDLVIFDEASQLPPEDAVGAIMRGARLVVVGDPKQLPPTNFFTAQSGQTVVPLTDDGEPLYDDAESVLEEFMGAGVPMSRLKWHYRSAHESLISFSNVSFYDADLYTFPSVETETTTLGLQFEHVADGVYEGKGLNALEARRVADEVVRFAREQLARAARGEETQSLGVGTFNLRQQLAIQDELEQRRRDDPGLEPFFDRGADEPFFVKNLENIQGDERDTIFLSVTYAKGTDGRLRYNFGPLSGQNGWRRLNVLTTRARRRMTVFSSMKGDEIDASAATNDGARLLREFLLYAERGQLTSTSASAAADAESPFEADVLRELTRRGLTVVPQVGVAGYRIDLGVLDPDALPGRFLCGIECDGVAYHSSETARDRDRLRQQVLEARGWTIHRVWSTDWFKDRQGQIERLLALVEATKRRAATERESARAARERAAAEDVLRRAEEEARAASDPPAPNATVERPYVRPAAAPYAMAPGAGAHAGRELLDAPFGDVVRAVAAVVEAESPVHAEDVVARVVGMWGTRAGTRIQARIESAFRAAERDGLVRRRGDIFWSATGDGCRPRSRAGTRIPADRIAPEEYDAAVEAVLAGGHAFSRPQLTSEVRALLGYGRTGAALDEAIGAAIGRLVAAGRLGEAATGVRLRAPRTEQSQA